MDTNTRFEVLRLAVTTTEAPGDVTSVLARASAFADFVEPPVIEKQPDVLVRGPQRLSAVELAVRDAKPIPEDDQNVLADSWNRCDEVFSSLGANTPKPMPGESSMLYRRRTAKLLKEHSPTWKATDLSRLDDVSFGIAEGQIIKEAAITARSPATVTNGGLRMIEKKRDGHIVREFVGEPRAWMDDIAGRVQMRGEGKWLHNLGQGNH